MTSPNQNTGKSTARNTAKNTGKRIAIVGGGLAGLVSAYYLRKMQPTWSVTVFEAATNAGGTVSATQDSGYTFDRAANGVLPADDTWALFADLGLTPEPARDIAKNRYLFFRGALHPLPGSPQALLNTPLLSPAAKLRMALEPLAVSSPVASLSKLAFTATTETPTEGDESVYDCIARHFGAAAAARFAVPMVLGVNGGDARQTSMAALFPRLKKLEQNHTSLLKAIIAQQRQQKSQQKKHSNTHEIAPRQSPSKPSRRLSSLPGGLGTLTRTLAETLAPHILSAPIGRIIQTSSTTPTYTLEPSTRSPKNTIAPTSNVYTTNPYTTPYDAVILATPAHASAQLLAKTAAQTCAALNDIPFAHIRVVALGYKRVHVPHPLDGFGLLVPPIASSKDSHQPHQRFVRSIGVLFTSSLFTNRAPAGHVLLRVLLGGTHDPGAIALSQKDVTDVVRKDLNILLGITAPPAFVADIPWERGIPQYTIGHRHRVNRARAALPPGVFLTGSSYDGVGVNDTITSAKTTVAHVTQYLGSEQQ